MKKYLLPLLGVIAVGLAVWYFTQPAEDEETVQLTVPVKQGEFLMNVIATGELQAKRSEKIKGPNGMRSNQTPSYSINPNSPRTMSLKIILLNFFRIVALSYFSMLIYHPFLIGFDALFQFDIELVTTYSFMTLIYYLIFSFFFSLAWSIVFYSMGALIKLKKQELLKHTIIFIVASVLHSITQSGREIKNYGFFSQEVLIYEVGNHLVALLPFLFIFYFLYKRFGINDLRSMKEQPILQ
jgi:hypothetical protein